MLNHPYYPSPLIMLPYLLVGMITSPMMELPTRTSSHFWRCWTCSLSWDIPRILCPSQHHKMSSTFDVHVTNPFLGVRKSSLWFSWFWILMLLQPAYATLVRYAAIFIELKNAYLTLSDNPTRRQSRTQPLSVSATCGSLPMHSQLRLDEENSLDDLRVSNFRNPLNMAMTCVGCHFFNVFHVVNLKKQCPILRELQSEDLSKTSPSLGDDSLSIVGVILHSWWVRTTESRIVLDYCNSYYRLSLSCLNKYLFAVNFPLKPIGSNDWEHLNHY